MRNTIWNKHIPTLLAISIIVIGIALTSYLVKSGTVFVGQAEPAETPIKLKITNISDTSFTVSYSTASEVIGSVNFGKDNNLGNAAFDDRDQKSGSVAPYKIHNITVKDLTPEARYFFSVASGQNIFLNETEPFTVSTAPTLKDPTSDISLKGKVVGINGEKISEGLVYATADNAQVVSTVLSDNGSYLLPLSSMRSQDLSSYFTFREDTIIKILIESGNFKSSVSVSALKQTVPQISLSYDYDFTINTQPIASKSAQPLGFSSIPVVQATGAASTRSPLITLPKKNQEFSDQQPQFRGTALPNETVTVIIRSEENIEVKIATDAFGNWRFRPQAPLSPGQHTITIITRDAFGVLRSITQSFVVHAQGTQVSQSATPSATPTFAFPTRTPTPTPIRTPTPSPTPRIGTSNLTPTPTPTTKLSVSPTPTRTPTPTPILIVQNLTPTPTSITTILTTTPTPTLCPGCPTPTPTPVLTNLTPTPTSTTIANVTPTITIAPPGDSSVVTIGILGAAVAAIGGLLFLLTRTGI